MADIIELKTAKFKAEQREEKEFEEDKKALLAYLDKVKEEVIAGNLTGFAIFLGGNNEDFSVVSNIIGTFKSRAVLYYSLSQTLNDIMQGEL